MLTRRDWLRLSAAGVMGSSMSGWLETLAADTAANPKRKRACILLWMTGGPSQMDTFDLKPGHANGGPFKEIKTSSPDLRISEHLPKIARFGDRMAVVRSMSTKEGEHGRATFLMRTGYQPTGPIQYPTLGSLVSRELGAEDAPLPNFVSIGPFRFFNAAAYGPGFLGPQYAPLIVGDGNQFFGQQGRGYEQALKVQDIDLPGGVERVHADARIELLQDMESDFISDHPGLAPLSHKTAYDRAVKLMKTEANRAFNLDEEPPILRDAYGRNLFGQGCLLARRLVERGVRYVQLIHTDWDHHGGALDLGKPLEQICGEVDRPSAALIKDLKRRGLLEETLVIWGGEFGRTPMGEPRESIGRDHHIDAYTMWLAGGGIKRGYIHGQKDEIGYNVIDGQVHVHDLQATVLHLLGLDHTRLTFRFQGRDYRLTDIEGNVVREILA
jgi:hypothetical protein